MIDRKYEVITASNENKYLNVNFEIKNGEILSSFFFSEVTPFENTIRECLDNVLTGKSQFEEFTGNVTTIKIELKTTRVYDDLIYYRGTPFDESETYCELTTLDLKELIDEWCKKEKEFKDSK